MIIATSTQSHDIRTMISTLRKGRISLATIMTISRDRSGRVHPIQTWLSSPISASTFRSGQTTSQRTRVKSLEVMVNLGIRIDYSVSKLRRTDKLSSRKEPRRIFSSTRTKACLIPLTSDQSLWSIHTPCLLNQETTSSMIHYHICLSVLKSF